MIQNKEWIKPLLWYGAVTLPWGMGGYAVHSSASISTGLLMYWVIGLLAPLMYYCLQKKGFDAELGKARAAVHIPLWVSICVMQMVVFWAKIQELDWLWGTYPFYAFCLVLFVLTISLAVVSWLDRKMVLWYEKLKEKGRFLSLWLGTSFLIGWIPGVTAASFLWLFYSGNMHLDGFISIMFLMHVFAGVFFGKMAIAMAVFGTYVYFALEGEKKKRMVNVIFAAVFWLMLLYIPIVISLRLTEMAPWRFYFDPSYLSGFPMLSDLWLTCLSLWGAGKVTGWIFKE